MTRFFSLIGVLIAIVSLASCKSNADKASETVIAYATAMSADDSITAVHLYPNSKHFYGLMPHIGAFEVGNIKELNGSYEISGQSSYYDKNSRFHQQKLTFWVQNKNGDFVITDSKGMMELPEDLGTYPYQIGAITPVSRDVAIGTNYKDIVSCFYIDCIRKSWKLNNGIEQINWSWDADWGTPHGSCTIKNTLPFTVKNIQYKITYYNGDAIVGSDDGIAVYELGSGDLKSFTFYSSGVNGNQAKTAHIEFEVPEHYAIEWVLNDKYSGNEFQQYKTYQNFQNNEQ